jgi:hypothetical protein
MFIIQPSTRIHVNDQVTKEKIAVPFPEGSLFIVGGLSIHAGTEYDEDNVRIHFYIDAKGNQRKKIKLISYILIRKLSFCELKYSK